MRLAYFSPTPWNSFHQRPHKFVQWFHSRFQGQVLWVDPYPTRLPGLSDIRRFSLLRRFRSDTSTSPSQTPSWLRIVYPKAFPFEPLPFLSPTNHMFWGALHGQIEEFLSVGGIDNSLLVIGKPSLLALGSLARLQGVHTIFDAMDNFPEFYRGLSRRAMAYTQSQVIRSVDTIWVTSDHLRAEHEKVHHDVRLVLNGADGFMLQDLLLDERVRPQSSSRVFGYVGTVGDWFDWRWVTSLATLRPHDIVRIVGPLFAKTRLPLPANIQILPECAHKDALQHMKLFDVGLIPFKRSALTDGVDPIKYYEYRALGIPVISTEFGQMAYRASDPGVYISRRIDDIGSTVEDCLLRGVSSLRDSSSAFIENNSWEVRFDGALLPR